MAFVRSASPLMSSPSSCPSPSDPLALEKIKEEVTCAVCSDLYSEPKTLPRCLHTFCGRCIAGAESARRKLRESAADDSVDHIECPECRTVSLVVGGPECLKTNFMYANIVQHLTLRDRAREECGTLVEEGARYVGRKRAALRCGSCRDDVSAPAVAFCYDCTMALCDCCYQMHARTRQLAGHAFKTFEEIAQDSVRSSVIPRAKRTYLCPSHEGEILKLFCFDCDTVICRDCIVKDHRDHSFNFIQDVVSSERENLQNSLEPFHDLLQELERGGEGVGRVRREVEKVGEERERDINVAFDRCLSEVEERRSHFLRQSRRVTEEKLKAVDRRLDEVNTAQCQIASLVDFTSKMVKSASDVEVMLYRREILDRMKALSRLQEETSTEAESDQVGFSINPTCLSQLGAIVEESCAVASSLSGPTNPLQNETAIFTVRARDPEGRPLTHGGGACSAKLHLLDASLGRERDERDSENHEATVTDNLDGSYTVSFVPQHPGRASLGVFFNDIEIGESPLELNVVRNYRDISLQTFAFSTGSASPWAVTILNNHEVAVTASDQLVHIYTLKGEEVGLIKSNFLRPYGVWSDGEGALWVTDREGHNVQKFLRRTGGKFDKVSQFGSKGVNPGQFLHPRGVAVHPESGNVYVSDMKNNRVQIFGQKSATPCYKSHFGGPGKGPGLFNLPAGLCFDRKGQLAVCDDHNSRIQVFDREGHFVRCLGVSSARKGILCSPVAIACDSHGRYIVSEFGSHTVTFLSPEGKALGCVRHLGMGYGQLVHPRGVTSDSAGSVYVADTGNMRVVRF